MLKTILTVAVIALAFTSCKRVSTSDQNNKMNVDTTANASFNKMLDQYYEEHLPLSIMVEAETCVSPMIATLPPITFKLTGLAYKSLSVA